MVVVAVVAVAVVVVAAAVVVVVVLAAAAGVVVAAAEEEAEGVFFLFFVRARSPSGAYLGHFWVLEKQFLAKTSLSESDRVFLGGRERAERKGALEMPKRGPTRKRSLSGPGRVFLGPHRRQLLGAGKNIFSQNEPI